MKSTYDFDSKARAREKLRGFVKKFYKTPVQRRNLRVLTMCGHEKVEFEQIWDPLGVRRENVYVIEKDPNAYNLILDNYPGCVMPPEPISALEYVQKIDRTFDVVNLDYMGVFDREKRDILRTIAGRLMLGDKGVVATWYSGKRENGYSKDWFEDSFQKNKNETSDSQNWKDDRDHIISRMTNAIFLDGITNLQTHPLLGNERIREIYQKKYPLIVNEEVRGGLLEDGIDYEKEIVWDTHIGPRVIREIIIELLENTNINKSLFPALEEILFYRDIHTYSSVNQERYKYISDNGCPMIVDFNYFKEGEFKGLPSLVGDEGEKIKVEYDCLKRYTTDKEKDKEKTRVKINQFIKHRQRALGYDLAPRIFLGSSASSKSETKTKKKREKKIVHIKEKKQQNKRELTPDEKDAIRALNREGFSPSEIYESQYDNDSLVTKPMIGAVCAWNKIWANQNN